MVDQETGEIVDPRPFSDWLEEHRRGATHAELSQALAEVAAAVAETNKVGTISLKIKISPSGDGMVVVTDEINAKAPEPDRSASLYFYDDIGNLTREDPRQQRLELRDVHDIRDKQKAKPE